MKINQNKIFLIKKVWIDSCSDLTREFRTWLREDCRERFRYVITTYYGDHCHGAIDVRDLKRVIEEEIEELEDVNPKFIEELKQLLAVALENNIAEILFD